MEAYVYVSTPARLLTTDIPKYSIPTVDELLLKLNNANCFSCVDVYKGFTNIELDKNSSFLTTMRTPIGRYRWLRMPFGVRLGPEEYQRRLHEVLERLVGIVNKAATSWSLAVVILLRRQRRIMTSTCGTSCCVVVQRTRN